MDSPTPYQELASALRTRLSVIANRELYERDPAGHLEQLKAASEKIDEVKARLAPPPPGDLAHYLQGCSYEKALAWLEARGHAS